jgi:hypothetical protein
MLTLRRTTNDPTAGEPATVAGPAGGSTSPAAAPPGDRYEQATAVQPVAEPATAVQPVFGPGAGPAKPSVDPAPSAADPYVARAARSERTLNAADVLWRLVRLAVWTVSAVIALAIVFRLLGANAGNAVVNRVDIWAHTLASPFVGMFTLHSAKWTLALDYAIAIVVYILLAELVIGLIGAAVVPARRRAGEPLA